jgi:transposase-like protein
MEDRGCHLGLAGRARLVELVEDGASLRAAAAALGVAPGTAHRWWHRWQAARSPLLTVAKVSVA